MCSAVRRSMSLDHNLDFFHEHRTDNIIRSASLNTPSITSRNILATSRALSRPKIRKGREEQSIPKASRNSFTNLAQEHRRTVLQAPRNTMQSSGSHDHHNPIARGWGDPRKPLSSRFKLGNDERQPRADLARKCRDWK